MFTFTFTFTFRGVGPLELQLAVCSLQFAVFRLRLPRLKICDKRREHGYKTLGQSWTPLSVRLEPEDSKMELQMVNKDE